MKSAAVKSVSLRFSVVVVAVVIEVSCHRKGKISTLTLDVS